jgi:DNA-binding NarL/FixJ family response regulator
MVGTRGSPGPIRVLVVDEHPVIRAVIRKACDSIDRLDLVGEAGEAAAAAAACSGLAPDIVVTDIDLTGGGIAAIRAMRAGGYAGRILVITQQASPGTVLDCLRLGVGGYLEKARGLREVGSSILRVALGEQLIDPGLAEAAVVELGRLARSAREGSRMAAALSRRELDVLRRLSDGATLSTVAKQLEISPRTVEAHVAKLYRKLGVRTRIQAVSRAASLGLIDIRSGHGWPSHV